jgi:opacity protein-like surface antigen
METKKDLGKIFKKRVEELNEAPDGIVWERLESSLKVKKKKRVFLFFILGFFGFVLLSSLFIYNNTAIDSEIPQVENDSIVISNGSKVQKNKKQDVSIKKSGSNSVEINEVKEKKQLRKASIVLQEKTLKTTIKEKRTKLQVKKFRTVRNEKKSIKNRELLCCNFLEMKKIQLEKENKPFLKLKEKNIQLKKERVLALKSMRKKLEEEEEEKKEKQITNWSIKPSVFITYYSFYSQGSSAFNNIFDNSIKSNQFSFNYGLLLNYRLKENLEIRIGLNKLNLNYTIENVPSYTNGQTLTIHNINGLITENNIDVQQDIEQIFSRPDFNFVHEISYTEISLEMKYKFPAEKITPYGAGGLSYLTGQNNTLYANENNSASIRLGTINTLNEVNLSFNFGFGFETQITERFTFDLELMHKYYLSTYKSSDINLNPFTLNFHVGLRYKL